MDKALELLDTMHQQGLAGAPQLYNSVISSCACIGASSPALEVFLGEGKTEGGRGVGGRRTWRWNPLQLVPPPLDPVATQGLPPQLRPLPTSSVSSPPRSSSPAPPAGMQEAGVEPTAQTVNLLLTLLAQAGQVDQGLWLLQEAERARYELGQHAYHSVLVVLSQQGRWQAAVEVQRQMQRMGTRQDSTTAGLVLAACINGGNASLATQLAEQFRAVGLLLAGSGEPAPAAAPAAAAPAAASPSATNHGTATEPASSSGTSSSTARGTTDGITMAAPAAADASRSSSGQSSRAYGGGHAASRGGGRSTAAGRVGGLPADPALRVPPQRSS